MNKNIVFITNIKNPLKPERSEVYDLSIQSWKIWCSKNNCDLFVLDEPLFPLDQMSPIYFRHYWPQLLPDVTDEQICTVDADTIIHPDCPNFFEETEGKYCGVHNDGDYDWIIRSIENYLFTFKENPVALENWNFYGWNERIWKYINSGFMITNRNFQFLHEKLLDFYWKYQKEVVNCQKTFGVGTDQPLINLFISGMVDPDDFKVLPYRFNMQDLARKGVLDERFLFCEIPGIYHFNAIEGGPERVNYWMKKTYNHLFKNGRV